VFKGLISNSVSFLFGGVNCLIRIKGYPTSPKLQPSPTVFVETSTVKRLRLTGRRARELRVRGKEGRVDIFWGIGKLLAGSLTSSTTKL